MMYVGISAPNLSQSNGSIQGVRLGAKVIATAVDPATGATGRSGTRSSGAGEYDSSKHLGLVVGIIRNYIYWRGGSTGSGGNQRTESTTTITCVFRPLQILINGVWANVSLL